jgi:hypothetical protein
MEKPFQTAFLLLTVALAGWPAWSREKAPDPLLPGSLPVSVAEYRSEAAVRPEILPARATEYWARAYWPSGLGQGPYPLILVLHGNHATCGTGTAPRVDVTSEYTLTGSCPDGSVIVPSHAGYDYLARHLASWGYIVVSVNANRGINGVKGVNVADWSNNYARGRLLLGHLKMLAQWNAGALPLPESLGLGPDGLKGKVDLSQVGLIGHSRGGEAVRVASSLYRERVEGWREAIPGLRIRAIFEIGATDWQTNRTFNADGASWAQLLPMCDGDVKDLEGRRAFDRMLSKKRERFSAQKAVVMVWGANHNFFNTEWQKADSAEGCPGGQKPIFDPAALGSPAQRKVATAFVSAFFRSRLGPHPATELARVFNPLYELPDSISSITRVEREFSLSPNAKTTPRLESFTALAPRNSHKHALNQASGVQVNHFTLAQTVLPVGQVAWSAAGEGTFLQLNWTRPGTGQDASALQTLDFRVGPDMEAPAFEAPADFSIALVDASEAVSAKVRVGEWVEILGLAKPTVQSFQTVRIPLALFTGVDLARLRGVRVIFDRTPAGQLLFASFRLGARLE